jgi:hypothetical protein
MALSNCIRKQSFGRVGKGANSGIEEQIGRIVLGSQAAEQDGLGGKISKA